MPHAMQLYLPDQIPVIRGQLHRILTHPLFARSERMGRFLRFAVEQALQGNDTDLKEYSIGIEVFDRQHSYDPRVDPIVRVEARRLRSKLQAYLPGGRSGRSGADRIAFRN